SLYVACTSIPRKGTLIEDTSPNLEVQCTEYQGISHFLVTLANTVALLFSRQIRHLSHFFYIVLVLEASLNTLNPYRETMQLSCLGDMVYGFSPCGSFRHG